MPRSPAERKQHVHRWQGLDDVPDDWGSSVVTIGEFDGVHRGHQRIVARAAEIGARLRLPVVVITFDPHPDEVVRPGSHPPLLSTSRRRAQLLAGLGVDAVCVLPFTYEFSQLGPDEFVRAVLVERLHAAAVIVGANFRFGHRAAGDAALLGELGEKYDFTAEGVPVLAEGGVTISSSRIRELLAAGDVAGAARDLGRPHRVEGVVVRGHQRGRSLGFPTANLETPPHTAIPAEGIYAGWLACLDLEGGAAERWPAAISVGTNPTFDDQERSVEAYALDRDDLDLYGAHVALDFAARLRGTVRFGSAGDLIAAMRRDVDATRAITAPDRAPLTAPPPDRAAPDRTRSLPAVSAWRPVPRGTLMIGRSIWPGRLRPHAAGQQGEIPRLRRGALLPQRVPTRPSGHPKTESYMKRNQRAA